MSLFRSSCLLRNANLKRQLLKCNNTFRVPPKKPISSAMCTIAKIPISATGVAETPKRQARSIKVTQMFRRPSKYFISLSTKKERKKKERKKTEIQENHFPSLMSALDSVFPVPGREPSVFPTATSLGPKNPWISSLTTPRCVALGLPIHSGPADAGFPSWCARGAAEALPRWRAPPLLSSLWVRMAECVRRCSSRVWPMTYGDMSSGTYVFASSSMAGEHPAFSDPTLPRPWLWLCV
jgi:hypothetical protein